MMIGKVKAFDEPESVEYFRLKRGVSMKCEKGLKRDVRGRCRKIVAW